MTVFVRYNYADNFLHLCTETHESHTCLTLAKNSSIMEKLYLMVTLNNNYSSKLRLLAVGTAFMFISEAIYSIPYLYKR